MTTDVNLNLNGLVVGKDEVLVVTLPTDSLLPPDPETNDDPFHASLMEAFEQIGLKDRVLLIYSDNIQISKVQK